MYLTKQIRYNINTSTNSQENIVKKKVSYVSVQLGLSYIKYGQLKGLKYSCINYEEQKVFFFNLKSP